MECARDWGGAGVSPTPSRKETRLRGNEEMNKSELHPEISSAKRPLDYLSSTVVAAEEHEGIDSRN